MTTEQKQQLTNATGAIALESMIILVKARATNDGMLVRYLGCVANYMDLIGELCLDIPRLPADTEKTASPAVPDATGDTQPL